MVRATFAGFSTAFSALQANQKRLDITGQNLANMNTTGYTRQQLQVSSLNYTNPVSHYMSSSEVVVGFGVHMDTVTQIRDPYLDIQYREQMQKSGYSSALQESFDELAKFMDESHIDGIRQAFDNIQSTLTNMHDPDKDDPFFETELRSRIQALTNLLNDGARQIEAAKKNEYNKLDGTGTNEQGAIQRVNDILQQVGRLNRQIKQNQIYGQSSLELMDERNVLLDELSSYIPIEVTYYKDAEHDGLDADGNASDAHKGEKYHLDSSGNIIMKKEWPDDLRVTMSYTDADGNPQTVVLVEGTIGTGDENFGSLEVPADISEGIRKGDLDPSAVQLVVHGFWQTSKPNEYGTVKEPVFVKTDPANQGDPATVTNQFPSGSIQAGLDMLWKDGVTENVNDVRGYDYYMDQLDNLASAFATVFNTINQHYTDQTGVAAGDPPKGSLLSGTTAADIKVHQDWINAKDPYIGTHNGENQKDAVLDLLEAMSTTYPVKATSSSNFLDENGNLRPEYAAFANLQLENNSFANYMNHVSTVLANDSYSNQVSLKTNVTVLNGIQNSRDSVSGVSLDEEASNMMMYMSAYNAASRLMTTLDQTLDVLINSTGTVGR